MTYLLASVTSLRETEVALDGGADIIDLQDVGRGPPGALSLPLVTETVALVARRRPICATPGELPMDPELLVQRVGALSETGVDYIRVGLHADPRQAECITALSQVAQRVALLGVLFADRKPDLGLLQPMARAGFAGVMLDVAHKGQGGLRRHIADAGLGRFVGRAAMHGLLCGLAGSLAPEDIPPLLALGPDLLCFRAALCTGGHRLDDLDPAAVARLRQQIPRHGESELATVCDRPVGIAPADMEH